MESRAWDNDLEMGGDEVDVTRRTIESTLADTLEGLEAAPSVEDIQVVEEVVVWRG